MEYSKIEVSIIIPTRNALTTIDQSIQSILANNSLDHVEIIIVNDGMEENMARIANKYPVKVIESNGSGPAAARNTGVKYSKGEILIFLDASFLLPTAQSLTLSSGCPNNGVQGPVNLLSGIGSGLKAGVVEPEELGM